MTSNMICHLSGRVQSLLLATSVLFASFLFLPIAESAAFPTGIVSYWQFDEGSGSMVIDSVGDCHGTVVGATWTGGLVNGALSFDGMDDIVHLPTISGYGNFTMSAWFKTSFLESRGTIFQTGMGYFSLNDPTSAYGDATVYLTFPNRAGGGGTQYAYLSTPSDMISIDEWHYAVMTATSNNSELKAYLDGEFIGYLVWGFTGWNSTLNYANIGALKASLWPGNMEGEYFSGLIDEVALFDRALSLQEISYYYQLGLNGQDLSTIAEPVPIPATILLFSSGLVGLMARRRLKRATQKTEGQ